jgi:hypothetical protein
MRSATWINPLTDVVSARLDRSQCKEYSLNNVTFSEIKIPQNLRYQSSRNDDLPEIRR